MEIRILGIDYGEKRVGLALSDPSGRLALPLAVLPNSSRLAEQVAGICRERGGGARGGGGGGRGKKNREGGGAPPPGPPPRRPRRFAARLGIGIYVERR